MHYTNIIEIKDVVILEKTKKKKKLLEDIAITTAMVEVA